MLPYRNTDSIRKVRRNLSRQFKREKAEFVLSLAKILIDKYDLTWFAYELIKNHKEAFERLDQKQLEALGTRMNSWDTVDSFARILSGPAWLRKQISDETVKKWATSNNLWWRRAALVSTVALNTRSQGGKGDVSRTLSICTLLSNDHEGMVEKGMSWALRKLVVHDPKAVQQFLDRHKSTLSFKVKREVKNKLQTGLKNPKK